MSLTNQAKPTTTLSNASRVVNYETFDTLTTTFDTETRTFDQMGTTWSNTDRPVSTFSVTNSPGTMADDATVGTVAWTNPDNAKVEDGVFAIATFFGISSSHYLKATNFNFNIPTTATVEGILVEVKRNDQFFQYVSCQDNAVRIIKGGSIGSTDKSSTDIWGQTLTYKSYGDSTDLWGETWTPADINSSDFGFSISTKKIDNNHFAAPRIDHIRITVYYTSTQTNFTNQAKP